MRACSKSCNRDAVCSYQSTAILRVEADGYIIATLLPYLRRCRTRETEPAMQDLSSLPVVDQIEILEVLGRGGMSVVYKARQTVLDRVVALKVLSRAATTGEDSVKRFQQEARISNALDHANIARTYSFGISKDGRAYLVMEYLEGKSLREELKSAGRLTLRKFRDVFLPVLDGLGFAHKSGLVHRDIKPGNIMLCNCDDGGLTVKIVDFGIAKDLGGGTAQALTRTGDLLGSPVYMSPEQCEGKPLDGRSDLYSLACVMYEALCGEPPFTADTALEIMRKHCLDAPPTVADLTGRIEISEDLAAAILWGLSREPGTRPQSAEELALRLGSALENTALDRVPILKGSAGGAAAKGVGKLLLAVGAILVSACLIAFCLRGLTAGPGGQAVQEHSLPHSLHDWESRAVKARRLGMVEEALAAYDEAILAAEANYALRRTDLFRLLNDVLVFVGQSYEKLDTAAAQKLARKGLVYSDKGITLALETETKEANLLDKMQSLFSDAADARATALGFLGSPSPIVQECVSLYGKAEKKWGEHSMAAMQTRALAVTAYQAAGELKKAEQLALESISRAEKMEKNRSVVQVKFKEHLARVYLQEGKKREFDALFAGLRKDFTSSDKPQFAQTREFILVNLINLSQDVAELKDIGELVRADQGRGRMIWNLDDVKNADMLMCLARRACALSGQSDLTLHYYEAALLQTVKFKSNGELAEIRRQCLQELVAIYKSRKDLTGQRQMQAMLDSTKQVLNGP
jgi:hypothetical protein